MEKRQFERDILNIGIQMKINNKEIFCNLQNMSNGGALAKIDKIYSNYINEEDIGNEISFSVGFDPLLKKKYKGQIVRLIEEDGFKFIAIYFF